MRPVSIMRRDHQTHLLKMLGVDAWCHLLLQQPSPESLLSWTKRQAAGTLGGNGSEMAVAGVCRGPGLSSQAPQLEANFPQAVAFSTRAKNLQMPHPYSWDRPNKSSSGPSDWIPWPQDRNRTGWSQEKTWETLRSARNQHGPYIALTWHWLKTKQNQTIPCLSSVGLTPGSPRMSFLPVLMNRKQTFLKVFLQSEERPHSQVTSSC